jgi:hypothetical protein
MSENHANGEKMARKWAKLPQSVTNATSLYAHTELHNNLAVNQRNRELQ